MYHARIAAAEEIQLLLPDNLPDADDHRPILLFGIGIFLVSLPFWSSRLLERPHRVQ